MIDYWDGLDREEHGMLHDDYLGWEDAIIDVLSDNEIELMELAESPE